LLFVEALMTGVLACTPRLQFNVFPPLYFPTNSLPKI